MLAGIFNISPGVKQSDVKRAVDKALAEVFTVAPRPDIFANLTGQGQGSYDHLVALRDATPWARGKWTVTWFKFFLEMVYARIKWKAYPRPPFNTEQHTATAKSIDAFLEAAQDLWSPVHFAFQVGKREHSKPKNDAQSAGVEAASTITSSSPAETSEDTEFDMGSLLAALISDTTADDIISGIERMVIKEDDESDDGEDEDNIF